jgi:uncharacterized protein (TIGR02466 family)
MATKEIFPTLIYKTKFPGDVKQILDSILPKLETWFKETKNNNQGSMRNDGLCSYNVKRDLHTWEELKEVVDFINNSSYEYWKSIGYKSNMRPGVYEMWANRYTPGSFIDYHNHAPIHMTATFILQRGEGAGNIVFENPLETLLKHQPYEVNAENFYNLFEEEIEGEPGDLVIFPGYLKHKTRPNNSSIDRIMLGANVCNVI